MKALPFGLHREKRYTNIYIQYNTMVSRNGIKEICPPFLPTTE